MWIVSAFSICFLPGSCAPLSHGLVVSLVFLLLPVCLEKLLLSFTRSKPSWALAFPVPSLHVWTMFLYSSWAHPCSQFVRVSELCQNFPVPLWQPSATLAQLSALGNQLSLCSKVSLKISQPLLGLFALADHGPLVLPSRSLTKLQSSALKSRAVTLLFVCTPLLASLKSTSFWKMQPRLPSAFTSLMSSSLFASDRSSGAPPLVASSIAPARKLSATVSRNLLACSCLALLPPDVGSQSSQASRPSTVGHHPAIWRRLPSTCSSCSGSRYLLWSCLCWSVLWSLPISSQLAFHLFQGRSPCTEASSLHRRHLNKLALSEAWKKL